MKEHFLISTISLLLVDTVTSTDPFSYLSNETKQKLVTSGRQLQFDLCTTTCDNSSLMGWSERQLAYVTQETQCEVCRDDDKCGLYGDCCDCQLSQSNNANVDRIDARCSYYEPGWRDSMEVCENPNKVESR